MDCGTSPLAVVVASVLPVASAAVVVVVRIAGRGLIVVATPLMVVRTGVTVDALPLASTVTHGSKAFAESTRRSQRRDFLQFEEDDYFVSQRDEQQKWCCTTE